MNQSTAIFIPSFKEDKELFLKDMATRKLFWSFVPFLFPLCFGWFIYSVEKGSGSFDASVALGVSLVVILFLAIFMLIPMFMLRKLFSRYLAIIAPMSDGDFYPLQRTNNESFWPFRFIMPIIIVEDLAYMFDVFSTTKIEIKTIIKADLMTTLGANIFDLKTTTSEIHFGFKNWSSFYYYFISETKKRNPTIEFNLR